MHPIPAIGGPQDGGDIYCVKLPRADDWRPWLCDTHVAIYFYSISRQCFVYGHSVTQRQFEDYCRGCDLKRAGKE